ncbi:MAG: histidine phosphatase family protein [Proteobacteria bacterium]|nr:MAG: histidine phosphatase family protein [Pseudomonadota bacterium]
MLTLSLLRHGKSSWDDPDLEDRLRPLADRGRRAARKMGAYMERHGLVPGLILYSDAVRTIETLELVLSEFPPPRPPAQPEPALYLAPASTMLEFVQRTPPTVQHLLVLGHNPGMHGLALHLTGSGLRRDIATMATKFPTCALAVLTFDAISWSEVRTAGGRLNRFVLPRTLA